MNDSFFFIIHLYFISFILSILEVDSRLIFLSMCLLRLWSATKSPSKLLLVKRLPSPATKSPTTVVASLYKHQIPTPNTYTKYLHQIPTPNTYTKYLHQIPTPNTYIKYRISSQNHLYFISFILSFLEVDFRLVFLSMCLLYVLVVCARCARCDCGRRRSRLPIRPGRASINR
jgi:hypothetical protein